MTKMFANAGAPDGILVNTVCPGAYAHTHAHRADRPRELIAMAERDMIPLRRLGEPEEVAEIIVWLIGDLNTYATGAEFDITGGIALH